MLDPKFEAFITRLNTAKEMGYSENFLKGIKKTAADALVDNILENSKLHTQIQKLAPFEAIRIKRAHKDSRTASIIKAPDGEYQFIVETKKKNTQNKKRRGLRTFEGGSKSGKPAWRLDSLRGPIPTISLLETLSEDKKERAEKASELRKEVGFAWNLPQSEYLVRPVLGALYKNKKGYQQTIFAPQGIPLDELEEYGVNLTKAQRDRIAVKLCAAVAFLHKQGYVHQDLKLANAVLFIDETGDFQVSLIDTEWVSDLKNPGELGCTHGYEPPEVALLYAKPDLAPNDTGYDYLKKRYEKDGYSLGKKMATQIEKQYKKQPEKLLDLRRSYLTPHTANDVWALGVMLYAFYHQGKEPVRFPKGPYEAFFKNRTARLQTGLQALQLWEKHTGITIDKSDLIPAKVKVVRPKVAEAKTSTYVPLCENKKRKVQISQRSEVAPTFLSQYEGKKRTRVEVQRIRPVRKCARIN